MKRTTITRLKEPIDIVSIDAEKEGYVDYLNRLLPLLRPGGLILAHNVNMVPDYVKAVAGNAALDTVFYTPGAGLAVTLKKRQLRELPRPGTGAAQTDMSIEGEMVITTNWRAKSMVGMIAGLGLALAMPAPAQPARLAVVAPVTKCSALANADLSGAACAQARITAALPLQDRKPARMAGSSAMSNPQPGSRYACRPLRRAGDSFKPAV